jgi:hypothetical protein
VAPDFENTRSIELSGEMLIRVATGARPLRIRSPLMILTGQGPALLAVKSFPREISAQVEVLEGEIDVERAYQSSWQESAHVPGRRDGLDRTSTGYFGTRCNSGARHPELDPPVLAAGCRTIANDCYAGRARIKCSSRAVYRAPSTFIAAVFGSP